MNNINLVDDKWIPVIKQNSKFEYVSLSEIFSDGTNVIDLSVDTLERISLMRLLICIAEASLAFSDKNDAFTNAKNYLSELATTYLQKWKHKFNLFDAKYPFLQVADATEGASKPIASLNFYEATAQTKKFINSKPCSEKPTLHQIALKLLVFQNFDTGGTLGRFKWANEFTAKEQSGCGGRDCICTAQNALHAFVLKSNIIETIIANLVDPIELKNGVRIQKQNLGEPHWHFELTSQTTPTEAVNNNTKTFLGRLVPLCRAVKLLDCENVYLGAGLIYESFPVYREFTCTIVHDKKGDHILSTDINKDIWRSLQSLLANYQTNNIHATTPYALYSNSQQAFTLWVGGIINKRGQKSILKSIESSFHMPAISTNDIRLENLIKTYTNAVSIAENIESLLGKAIYNYKEKLKIDKKIKIEDKAKIQYWSILGKRQGVLMNLFRGKDTEAIVEEWKQISINSAKKVFETACPHQTPRMIIAYAKAREVLFK